MTDAFEPRSDFLRMMQERGYIHQCSDSRASTPRRVGVAGRLYRLRRDGASLHVGSLLQIMMLHWLQETGGKPIALMGGGTTMVGDPSGKDESRKLLTVEEIEANKAGIRKVFAHFMRFGEGRHDAIMADNADWLARLNYIEFLREVGRHFSVNRMLAMDSVEAAARARAGADLPRIQLHVPAGLRLRRTQQALRRHPADGRLGPVGQHRHRHRPRPPHGARAALRADLAAHHDRVGAKMGKTAAGAVWLDASMLSPYDYWQFWRNTEDADVGRFLKLFTLLPLDEIRRLESLPGPRSTRRRRRSPPRRRRCCTAARRRKRRRDRAQDVRGRRARGNAADGRRARAPNSTRASARSPPSSARASSLRPAKRAGRSAAAVRVNDAALSDEKALITREACRRRRRQAVARTQEACAFEGGVGVGGSSG